MNRCGRGSVMNYDLDGLSKEEGKQYIQAKLKVPGVISRSLLKMRGRSGPECCKRNTTHDQ